MLQEYIKLVFDTLYLLHRDTATNTEIYYFETVKLIKQSKTFWEYVSVWMPILIAVLALYYTYKESQRRKEEKELDKVEKRLQVKPFVVAQLDFINKNVKFWLTNQGLGTAIITKVLYKYDLEDFTSVKELFFVLTKNNIQKFIQSSSTGYNIGKILTINPNNETILFDLKLVDSNELIEFQKEFSKITVSIDYENIYGDKIKSVDLTFNYYQKINESIRKRK